ncbi:hypothetical protein BSLG_010438 [Batrachochytrium salamandrivorans]|nr:hypothetical protein BSLG_010438 [Batrachochytrium salamandrivorans]
MENPYTEAISAPTDIDSIFEAAHSIEADLSGRYSQHAFELDPHGTSMHQTSIQVTALGESPFMASSLDQTHCRSLFNGDSSNSCHKPSIGETEGPSSTSDMHRQIPHLGNAAQHSQHGLHGPVVARGSGEGHTVIKNIIKVMTSSIVRGGRPRSITTNSAPDADIPRSMHSDSSRRWSKVKETKRVSTDFTRIQGHGSAPSTTTNPTKIAYVSGAISDSRSPISLSQSYQPSSLPLTASPEHVTQPPSVLSAYPSGRLSSISAFRLRPRTGSDAAARHRPRNRSSVGSPEGLSADSRAGGGYRDWPTPTTDMDSFLSISSAATSFAMNAATCVGPSVGAQTTTRASLSARGSPHITLSRPDQAPSDGGADEHRFSKTFNYRKSSRGEMKDITNTPQHSLARVVSVRDSSGKIDVDQLLQIGIEHQKKEDLLNNVQVEYRDVDDVLSISAHDPCNRGPMMGIKEHMDLSCDIQSSAVLSADEKIHENPYSKEDGLSLEVAQKTTALSCTSPQPAPILALQSRSLSDPSIQLPFTKFLRGNVLRKSVGGTTALHPFGQNTKIDVASTPKEPHCHSSVLSLGNRSRHSGLLVTTPNTSTILGCSQNSPTVRISEEMLDVHGKEISMKPNIASGMDTEANLTGHRNSLLPVSLLNESPVGLETLDSPKRCSYVQMHSTHVGDVNELIAVGEASNAPQSEIEVVGFFGTENDQNHVIADVDRIVGLAGGAVRSSLSDLSNHIGESDAEKTTTHTTPPVHKLLLFLRKPSMNAI